MTVRNLFIGCDGTWNEPESATNVKRFLDAVQQTDRQVVHYEKGVGTRAFEALPGGIYGYGLEKRVLGSYRFLRKCFGQKAWSREQNRIFVLGFSRGAYTARRISGLLSHSGLPKKAEDVELGWEVYKQKDTRGAATLKREGRFYDVPVEMVGVWDTVKGTNDPDYNDAKMAPNVKAGYHAMAIDERRKFFPILKWNQDARAMQVWFPGVHSDVGGGYKEIGLSNGALRWMIFRAIGHGVAFRDVKVKAIKASPVGKIHESLQGVWTALGESQRKIPKTALIHPSVGTRTKQRAKYRPTNLPKPPRYWGA